MQNDIDLNQCGALNRILGKLFKICGIPLIVVLGTGLIPNSSWQIHPYVYGCEEGCAMAAAGYPFPFIIDSTHTSPVNSADWIGVFLGVDIFSFKDFFLSYGFWIFLIFSFYVLKTKIRQTALAKSNRIN